MSNKEDPATKQFKHIIFQGKHAFEFLTVCRKSMVAGVVYHDVIYHSIKGGYRVSVFNTMTDGKIPNSHSIYESTYTEDPHRPDLLMVSVDKNCLILQEFTVGVSGGDRTDRELGMMDFIPLSEIHKIRFDRIEGGDGSTDMDSLILRSNADLNEGKW